MKAIIRQTNLIVVIAAVLLCRNLSFAQMRFVQLSKQSKDFNRTASDANVTFTLPDGFKETVPVNNDDFNYDYAIALPDHSVEIWFAVKPYKSIARIYTNPDSAYVTLGKEQVSAFSADNSYFVRNLTDRILNQYNADVGKSYLLNLNDSPATKHYKYALVITLQKNKAGALMAVCLTNDKGPDFFREIDKARNCIKFK